MFSSLVVGWNNYTTFHVALVFEEKVPGVQVLSRIRLETFDVVSCYHKHNTEFYAHVTNLLGF